MGCLKIAALLGLILLPGCELAYQRATEAEQVTVGDFLAGAAQVNGQRYSTRDMIHLANVNRFNNCMVEAGKGDDWAASKELYAECIQFAKDNSPELFAVTIAKELKEAYKDLTDAQIRALGLPPRPE